MPFELLTALVAFTFVSSVTPGPNNLMLMASGTNYGIVRTVPHMLGVGIWVLIGTRIRRFLGNSNRLRAFNWIMAALLAVSVVPVLQG